MKPLSLYLSLLSFLPSVSAASRQSAPAGCITVSKSGSGQTSSTTFSTIQAAVNSLSTSSSSPQCIFLTPGTYREQVLIPSRQAALSIYGSTPDTSSYRSNTVTIISSLSQASPGNLNNDQTATLRVKANNFKLYNVNVENGYGKGSQAVALSAYASSGYYGCSFRGFQDTVLAQEGTQLFAKSEIVGVTDFIFGQRGVAWFEKVDLRVLSNSVGALEFVEVAVDKNIGWKASGRDSSTNANYYVFNNCDISAAAGQSVSNGAFYLGRPWREYARVVFQRTSMSSVINPAGWRIWNNGDERTSNVFFGEYGNTGPGASGTRASFARKLNSPVKIADILGGGYASAGWYDGAYIPSKEGEAGNAVDAIQNHFTYWTLAKISFYLVDASILFHLITTEKEWNTCLMEVTKPDGLPTELEKHVADITEMLNTKNVVEKAKFGNTSEKIVEALRTMSRLTGILNALLMSDQFMLSAWTHRTTISLKTEGDATYLTPPGYPVWLGSGMSFSECQEPRRRSKRTSHQALYRTRRRLIRRGDAAH
ncbi:Pectin lyase fold/virulence factor [Naviculisporaceae sp. PSN 640]